jgi:hypothetical protein
MAQAGRFTAMPIWIGLVMAFVAVAADARGQNVTDLTTKKAVGVGIFYGIGTINLAGPPDNATTEQKGYSGALPSQIAGTGPAIGLSFGQWGLVFGGDDNTVAINRFADVKGTPGNPADDVFVHSVRRVNRSITALWQPYRWVYFGLGKDMGSVSFSQTSAAGTKETRRFNFSDDFYSLGLAVGFDPTRNKIAPILTVFTKVPTTQTAFNGVTNAVGVGFYF